MIPNWVSLLYILFLIAGNLEDFDAVMFHIRDMDNGKIPVPNQALTKFTKLLRTFITISLIEKS